MDFPLVHFAKRTDLCQVHHRTSLRLDDLIAPTKSPAPFGHHFLERPCEFISRSKIIFDIFGTEGCLALG